ncbi:MAG: diacylglycerol kinase [Minisyncoccota bacterium]
MKIIRKFADARHGWRGLRAVWREEWHFKYQVGFAISMFTIAVLLGARTLDLVLLFSALSITLASEVINTAIEDVCNRIQPDFEEAIGAIKDMAQGFVLLSSLPSIALFLWIVITRIA